jgi:hypothetical protein
MPPHWGRWHDFGRRSADIPPVRSKSTREEQYNDDDQEDAEDTDADKILRGYASR